VQISKVRTILASNKFRHAFKVALATVIAYGLALSWDWPDPKWAALAVAVVSLPSMGESLVKGQHRLLGTLTAAVFTVILFAMFPQDRWMIAIGMSGWQALCVYKMADGKSFYFWYCAGFISAIIGAYAMSDPLQAFDFAVIRSMETGLGVFVYTVVALVLWPDAEDLPTAQKSPEPTAAVGHIFPDLDRLSSALNFLVMFWTGYLAIIYIPGFPSGLHAMGLLVSLSMMLAYMPQFPLQLIYVPLAVSLLLSSMFYLLIMPGLSGFGELAGWIFVITFLIGYLFYEPQKFIGRSLGLALFISIIVISNEQQYSFLSAANTSVLVGLLCLIAAMCRHLPVSCLPERRFLWQLERFQRSAHHLGAGVSRGPIARYLRAYHRYEVATLPSKMSSWRAAIPPALQEVVAGELDSVLEQVNELSEAMMLEKEAGEEALSRLAHQYRMLEGSSMLQPRY
jgi:hypothetical protein